MDLELTDIAVEDAPKVMPSINGVTHFDFQHRVFQLAGAFLSADQLGHPRLHVNLGEISASMPEDSIRREFGIDNGSHDCSLISLAAQALRFVPIIVPGDALPTEIIDGSASWPIEERHFECARHRLLLKLAGWAAQQEPLQVPPSQMARLLEEPEVQANLKKGFSDAASRLGLDERKQVVELLESASREMAYIEALRDYFAWITKVPKEIKLLQTALKSDREALESAIRSHQLSGPPLRQYRAMFQETEALFADIVPTLGRLPAVIQIIRRVRDDLHRQTRLWSEIQDRWSRTDFNDRKSARDAAALIYGFLAKNFLKAR